MSRFLGVIDVSFVPTVPHCDGVPTVWPSHLEFGKTVVIQESQTVALDGVFDSVTVGPMFEFLGGISTSCYHEIHGFCHLM
jgi:hypothetical protein